MGPDTGAVPVAPGRRGVRVPRADTSLSPEHFRAAAEAARLAPSIHNSQPWRFRRIEDGIAILEDLDRSLPVIDPQGRDRTISCGTALFNALITLRAAGHLTALELLPDPADPTLLGLVRTIGHHEPERLDQLLARAVPYRHTHRRVYRSHAVAEEDLLDLRQAVTTEGARLSVADPASRRRLAHLLRQAVDDQRDDPELRSEVERWVRREDAATTPVDGIPVHALGSSPYPVDSLVHGGHRGARDAEEIEDEFARSTVLVISTRHDTRHDWLITGLALQRLLLVATGKGLVATFADQALQDARLRPQVAEVLGIWGRPHILIRIGRALVAAPVTPRRRLEQILE